MLTESLLQSAEAVRDDIVALRRAIHAEPELGLQTPLTRDKVRAALAGLPLEWREGGATTGIVGILKGKAAGQSVVLRGDMDALPMDEHTALPFASTIPGRMHACGHDTHTAMLAGAAQILASRTDEFAGEIRFMFQPGEEGFHGARHMLEDGLLDPLPAAAFALHIMPNAPHGLLAGRAGAMMASADEFTITVTGRGGHASMPHDTRDPVPVAAEVITALQSMVTRRYNAAESVVVTVTTLDSGTAHNIIPDTATIAGTIRTLSDANRASVPEDMERLAKGIASAHEMEAELSIREGFPVTLNDPRAVAVAEFVARDLGGDGGWKELPSSSMGAEDWSYVLQKVPGMMAFLGVAEDGADWKHCCGVHSSKMMVDEAVLPKGSAFLAACALRYLEHGWDTAA